MTLNYFDSDDVHHLVEELFLLSFTKDDIPFKSTILPFGYTTLTFIYNPGQSVLFKEKETPLLNLMVTGQFQESYELNVKNESFAFGLTLHPTALHKITKQNIYELRNIHVNLNQFDNTLFKLLNPIFIKHKDNISLLTKQLKQAFINIPLHTNANVNKIDELIDIIHNKEGLINTYELLESVSFSQKTLETQFKKIVGVTPGKYIRLLRFTKLMRKFQSKEIDLADLIHMYNYYDQSHFSKDFKFFLKQSPKKYFRSEHPLLNKLLK